MYIIKLKIINNHEIINGSFHVKSTTYGRHVTDFAKILHTTWELKKNPGTQNDPNGLVIVSDHEIRHKKQLGWLIRSTNQFSTIQLKKGLIHRKSHEGTRCKRLHMQSTSLAVPGAAPNWHFF